MFPNEADTIDWPCGGFNWNWETGGFDELLLFLNQAVLLEPDSSKMFTSHT
jgi:hypothetical protein